MTALRRTFIGFLSLAFLTGAGAFVAYAQQPATAGQLCSDGTTSAAGTNCMFCPGIGNTANATSCATDQQNVGLGANGQATSAAQPTQTAPPAAQTTSGGALLNPLNA